MKKKLVVKLGIVAAGILIAGIWYVLSFKSIKSDEASRQTNVSTPEDGTARANEVLRPKLKADSGCYAYSLRSDILINPVPMAQKPVVKSEMQQLRLHITGILNRRDLGVGPEESTRYVAYQLEHPVVAINGITNPALSAMYGQLGIAVCGPAGHMLHFCLPAVLGSNEQDSIKGIFYPMQITGEDISLDAGADGAWIAEETDNTGIYQARYEKLSNSDWVKEKRQYIQLNERMQASDSLLMHAQLSNSTWQLKVSDGLIPETILGQETLELYMDDILVSRAETIVDVERVNRDKNETLAIWQLEGNPSNLCMQVFAEGMDKPIAADVWEQQRMETLRKKYAGIPVGDVVLALNVAVKKRRNHAETIPAIHALRDYLLVNPDEALDLPGMIKEQQADDQVAGRIILAMQLAGTEQAQTALLDILNDEEQRVNQRIQSVVACGGIEQPKEGVADTLWNAYDNQAIDSGIRDTALLSLGSLAGILNAQNQTNQAVQIREGLESRLVSGDTGQQELVLLALDNLGGLSHEELTVYVADNRPEIRAAAVQHYRHLNDEQSIDVLTDIFRNDLAPEVRQAAFDVLETSDDEQVQMLMRERLTQEKNDSVQRAVIKYLGKHNQNPENRQALEAMVAKEEDVERKKEIWRAVYRVSEPDDEPQDEYVIQE